MVLTIGAVAGFFKREKGTLKKKRQKNGSHLYIDYSTAKQVLR